MPVRLTVSPLEPRDVPSAVADRGPDPVVILRDADGNVGREVPVYESAFTGGVWTASADVTGDGTADVVAAPGPGRSAEVKVVDGKSGDVVRTIAAYEGGFTGGAYAVAADLTGDGRAEIVTGTDQGGGPRVRVFDGASDRVLADFFAIADPAFLGGVRVAVGDLSGDGTADLLVSAGFGGGPRLAGFDGKALARGEAVKLFADFFAFEDTLRNGCYPAAGDLDGDGSAELIVGAGPGGGPRVTAFDGAGLRAGRVERVQDFFAGDVNDRGGVRVGATRGDDGTADVLTAPGAGGPAAVYDGPTPVRQLDRRVALLSGAFADAGGGRLGAEPTLAERVRQAVRGTYTGSFPVVVNGVPLAASVTFRVPDLGPGDGATAFPLRGATVAVAVPGRSQTEAVPAEFRPAAGAVLTRGDFVPLTDDPRAAAVPFAFSWESGRVIARGPAETVLPDGTRFRFADGLTEHALDKV